jgi:prepilin-type processing-associated H-X9-DG protein
MARRETNPNPREELVGYLLDALDEPTHREVDTQVQANPELCRDLARLRVALAPLECDRDSADPPANLAANTLALIAAHPPGELPPAPPLPRNSAGPRSWWRRSDVLVASVLLFVALGIGATWVMNVRRQERIVTCQSNLRGFHTALMQYAETRPDGAFPRAEAQGPHAFAGVFVPILADAGLLPDSMSLTCPSRDAGDLSREPGQFRQLDDWYNNDRPRYDRAVASLSGTYSYSLGYRDEGTLLGLRRGTGNDLKPIMADCPPISYRYTASEGNSPDHGGGGQNVLFIDGSVRFVTNRVIAGDDIYLNDHNVLAAGLREDDCVLGYSDAVP